ncbi:DUF3828 domain-containing protein [Fibrella sp. WM1]|uniref:DUF3828 domain-containing protein n=1 Tax=Fibrella musci TaxID=3242485 RepID=UPI003522FAC4
MPRFRAFYVIAGLSWMAACSSPQNEQAQQAAADSVSRAANASAVSDSVTAPTAPSVTNSANPPMPTRSAQDVVAALYAAHDAQKSPFYQSESRTRIRQYFTSELANLIWRDAKSTSRGELGRLDADPLYDAQDTDVKEFIIQPAVVKNNEAEVQVTFSNLGAKKTFTFLLRNENGNWRIGDILYGDGSQLHQKLSGKAGNE